ncbi:hypothetical protein F5Y06DRAFT_299132 [Hypoxylon sp. FL0890]|nr:hypothetical protein F5Y06DRAFT_299132 [Hypoxylon sp. FL0890]
MAAPCGRDIQEYQCDKCQYKSSKARHLDSHTKYNHIGTVCQWPGCPVQTGTEERLRRHLKEVHCTKEEPDASGRILCPWPGCPKDFVHYSGVVRCCYFHTWDAMRLEEAPCDNEDDLDSGLGDEYSDEHDEGQEEEYNEEHNEEQDEERGEEHYDEQGNEPGLGDVINAIHSVASDVGHLRDDVSVSHRALQDVITRLKSVEDLVYQMSNKRPRDDDEPDSPNKSRKTD